MTDSATRGEPEGWRRAALLAAGRFLLTFGVILAAFYVIPFDAAGFYVDVVLQLVLGLVAVVLIVIWQLRQIGRARFPTLRAIESLGVAFPLFLCAYAATYLVLSTTDAASFSEMLSHTDALYFTTVVFGTVGFGDITPLTDAARLLVGSQILANLVFLALVVRALFAASRRTVSARGTTRRPD